MSNMSRIKTSLIIIAGLVLVTIGSSTMAASYGAGVLEFQMKLASNGNANAQYRLATMFESGQGTLKDHNQALQWYKKAADQNHKAAINRLTYIDIRENGFNGSHKAWLNSLEKSAASRDGEAILLLGQMYGNGVGVNQDNDKAIELLKQAKAKGVTGAEDELFKIENRLHSSRQQQLEKQKQDAARQARQDEQRRAAAAKSQAQRESAERERRRLAAEEKRKAEERRRQQSQKQPSSSQTQTQPQNEQFESDICKGKKARFLTACQ